MLWRVRAGLPDRPGSLAELAAACGRAGVNIQTVQVFPEGTSVTDELVLQVPQDWTAEQLHELVTAAGGEAVSAVPVTTAALEDQPTRYVQAVRAIIAQPATFPEVAAHLFDADVAPSDGSEDVLEMTIGATTTIQVRRDTPFTAIERDRASALAELVGEVLAAQVAPAPHQPAAGDPDFVTNGAVVSALAGGKVTGRAEFTPTEDDEPWPVDLWVDPAWHRRGVGTRLLADVARAARSAGAEEIVLTAPSDTKAVLPMVLAAGMRGRIRMAGDSLTVRIALADLRR
ncbi:MULTISPECIES: GNAT family N-acetyltransferase [unclassified Nocardioides]|uniref:GNAT family N-acetyltransferase n=1 Tax=unclassified Nocardioides TaxID=2615069 RepID=UPI001150A1EE|nr:MULTISPECIES: GNAT family N-acetyltransferase [unclassified Nocardioides]TQK72646.1 ACT domain-containing protein [Nocardioides sp. SLBN-35]WGY03150.1 GNAT family N-acetyltransferase [Nocardioides sp. QY071]